MYSACHSIFAEIQGASRSPINFEGSVGMNDTTIAKTSINFIQIRALSELETVCVLHTPVSDILKGFGHELKPEILRNPSLPSATLLTIV